VPDLQLTIESVEVVPHSAAPLLSFKVRVVNNSPDEIVHTVAMRAQILIEVARRKYNAEEQARLKDLFGEPDRWSQTLRNLLWTHANVVAPRFQGSVLVEITVPCTFDFNVAATKYFHGVTNGDLPLCFQFSGSVFYQAGWISSGRSDFLGQGNEVPPPGKSLEGSHGPVLSEFRVVGSASGHL